MSLVAAGLIYWPIPIGSPGPATGSLSAVSFTLDSTTDALAWVGRSYVTDSVATIYFRTGTIPAAGGDTVDVRIETVVNGRPSGTLWAANTNVTVVIADSDDNVWKTATLTAAASLVPGSEFAIVIASSTGTPSITIMGAGPGLLGFSGHYPLLLHNATGSYAQAAATGGFEWLVNMTTAGIIPFPGLSPIDGDAVLTAYNSGTSPDERALRFQVPMTCQCIGARVWVANIAAGGDFSVSLWNAVGVTDAAALAQISEDGDVALSTSQDGYFDVYFNAAVELTINTTYYLGLRADTANNITLPHLTTAGTGEPANAIRGFPIPNSGAIYLATRTWTAGTAGAWTDTTTSLPLISLILNKLGDGAGGTGGGGATTHRIP